MKLDRNKIITIGKNPKTVTLQAIAKLTNSVLNSFEIYKVIRRKNKVFCYCLNGKAILAFDTLIKAKKQIKIIKENLK